MIFVSHSPLTGGCARKVPSSNLGGTIFFDSVGARLKPPVGGIYFRICWLGTSYRAISELLVDLPNGRPVILESEPTIHSAAA